MWRGYRTRNLNKNVAKIYQHVQMLRFNQYIKYEISAFFLFYFQSHYNYVIFRQMSKDLVDTKSTLEKEHKLVLLQMQAINELWKKVFFVYTTKNDVLNCI